jgi:hypothetical protein
MLLLIEEFSRHLVKEKTAFYNDSTGNTMPVALSLFQGAAALDYRVYGLSVLNHFILCRIYAEELFTSLL